MPTISSAGIGSGLDVSSIVSQLVALERQPIQQLQTAATKLSTQLSSYGKLKSAMAALRDAASKLTESNTWSVTKASSSNGSVATATTGAAAPTGTFSVTVQGLAASQSLASSTYASSTAVVGTGTLRIELGTWGAGQTSFTPKAGTSAVDIVIGAGDNTLDKIRDRINAANAGVTASIVNDVNGARLSLRATNSGLANAFRVSATADGDGNLTDAAGLSALSYDTAVKNGTQSQAAANAGATINGLAVQTASNTMTDVVAGLTINVGQVSATAADITVAQDNDAIKKSLTDFVTAYNDLNKQLRDLSKYDASTKVAGSLQGDRAVAMIQSQMRGLEIGTFSGSTVFTKLSDIGFELQQDGSLKQNTTRLDAALANLPELKKLFTNVGSDDSNGFARRFKSYGDGLLGVEGALTTGTDGIQKRINANKDRQSVLEKRVEMIEKRLRAQYTALDGRMGQLSGLAGYVSQQLSALNNGGD